MRFASVAFLILATLAQASPLRVCAWESVLTGVSCHGQASHAAPHPTDAGGATEAPHDDPHHGDGHGGGGGGGGACVCEAPPSAARLTPAMPVAAADADAPVGPAAPYWLSTGGGVAMPRVFLAEGAVNAPLPFRFPLLS